LLEGIDARLSMRDILRRFELFKLLKRLKFAVLILPALLLLAPPFAASARGIAEEAEQRADTI
jgi:hypothetical protein